MVGTLGHLDSTINNITALQEGSADVTVYDDTVIVSTFTVPDSPYSLSSSLLSQRSAAQHSTSYSIVTMKKFPYQSPINLIIISTAEQVSASTTMSLLSTLLRQGFCISERIYPYEHSQSVSLCASRK